MGGQCRRKQAGTAAVRSFARAPAPHQPSAACLNMMGLIHSRRSPPGRRCPKVRVYPATSGSPNLLP